MKTDEIIKLFDRIKMHYTMFTYNDEKVKEWHKFLKDYSNEDVNRRLDEYLSYGYEQPPFCMALTKGIEKIKKSDEDDSWVTECDICKEKIRIYGNDMSEFDKHYRKCQKIDFIDRIVFRYKGQHIAIVKYYQMSDEELEDNYQRTMKYYREHRDSKPSTLKQMPEGD